MICSNDDYDIENSDNYDDDSNYDVYDGNNDVDNGDGNFDGGDDDLDDSNHCWLTAWGKCLLDSPIPDNIIACYQHSGQSRQCLVDTQITMTTNMMMMTTMMQSKAGINTVMETVGPVIYLERKRPR